MEMSAGAVIFREGEGKGEKKYLLLHYTAGHWDFVKGHIERGEKERDTVIRETKEETGIGRIEFLEGFREKIRYFFWRRGKKVYKEVIFFLARTEEVYVRLSHEHKDFAWLGYEEALERLTYKNAKNVMMMAEEHLRES